MQFSLNRRELGRRSQRVTDAERKVMHTQMGTRLQQGRKDAHVCDGASQMICCVSTKLAVGMDLNQNSNAAPEPAPLSLVSAVPAPGHSVPCLLAESWVVGAGRNKHQGVKTALEIDPLLLKPVRSVSAEKKEEKKLEQNGRWS